MPGRSFSAGSAYRYGFNGQEKSDEIGDGLTTALFWEYDSRIGRRWNIDPAPTTGISEYAVYFNNPVRNYDVHGDTPSVKEAAEMANDSYNKYDDRLKISGGWERLPKVDGVTFEDIKTDFQSALYRRTVNGKTEYTYATAGTASGQDGWQDLLQPFGKSGQYDFSILQAKNLVAHLSGQELTFTGHSLGGGTAAANALTTNKAAITFNAAGVGYLTKKINGMSRAGSQNIKAFILPGEMVDYYQGKVNSTADGQHIYVHPWYGKVGNYSAALLRAYDQTVFVRLYKHLMSNMFKALTKSGYGTFSEERVVPVPQPPARTDFSPTNEEVQQTWNGIMIF